VVHQLPDAVRPPEGRGGLPAHALGGRLRRAMPDAGRGPAGLGQGRAASPGGPRSRAASAEDAERPCQPRRRGPGVPGAAGDRASPAGRQAPPPGPPANPVCPAPGEVWAAVPGAESSAHETEGTVEAPGSDRAEQPGDAGVGALLPHGGCATALPSAGSGESAPALGVAGQTLAESEGAPGSPAPADRGMWPGATDAAHPRSCAPMTPGGSRSGKRLAGTLPEPCDRADGGRAA
jgi:hypothetical protein